MRWWGGAGIVILVSAFSACIGVGKLIKTRKWFGAALYIIAVVGYPCVLAAVARIENDPIRLWIGAPVAAISQVWLLSGIFIKSYADDKL
jgi:hypothetical protein